MKQSIEAALTNALRTLGVADPLVALEHPGDLAHGDYASGVALRYAKEVQKNPRALAEEIVAALGTVEGVEKIEIAGPGFINFHLSSAEFDRVIAIARKDDMWGSTSELKGKQIMVEFTDPNPFKEFHIGHLMSNTIGESISRLFEFSGATVKRANYQGDVGLHVAKAIHGMQLMEKNFPRADSSLNDKAAFLGQAYAVGAKSYESGYKSTIDDLNKIIYEKSDLKIDRLYEWGLKTSLDYFEVIYDLLGMQKRDHFGKPMHFDYYFFESGSWEIGQSIVKNYTPKVFEVSEGAYVFHGEKIDPSLHTRVFITSKGLPTYEAKELGLLKSKIDKWGWDFDRSITITAHEQAEYFKVVMAAAKQIEELSSAAIKTKHVTHGVMRFASGKMSSRTGDVITALSLLSDLFKVAVERAKESRANDPEILGRQVSLAAVKYQILKQSVNKDIIFDRERALSLEGDSGPYLQYVYARCASLLDKAFNARQVQVLKANDDRDFPEVAAAYQIRRMIYKFPDIVERAAKEMEPHHVATYLIELGSLFNRWYGNERIIVEGQILPSRVALIEATAKTIKNGLWILGIPAPEKM